jgi:hypothetical protein
MIGLDYPGAGRGVRCRAPIGGLRARLAGAVAALALSACASWQAPVEVDDSAIRARAITATERDVSVSAAVLGAGDSRGIFGVDIIDQGIQPVWIEVRNASPRDLWLLRSGTDPDYFSPLEVAWSQHRAFSGETNAGIDAFFDRLGFPNPIPAGSTRTGILFTNPHREVRLLNIDLFGDNTVIPFTLFTPVPGNANSDKPVEIVRRYAENATADYSDEATFRAALEQMPCCATGEDAASAGDPVNMVLVGELEDVAAAVTRRGYRGDMLDFDRKQRLFGRPADAVVRKSGQGGVPANWLRVWVAPLRYRGKHVFLVQTGRPVGGRFAALLSDDLSLHPNVDEARNLVVQDMMYSGSLGKLGFVRGGGAAAVANNRGAVDAARYFTDGLRAVMFLETRPLALSDVQILDWEPNLKQLESATGAKPGSGID